MTDRGSSSQSSDEEQDAVFGALIDRARSGESEAVGRILNECRNYLLLVANDQFDREVQGKLGPSDIVQESMLAAQAEFGSFHGATRQELLGWLRGILKNKAREAARHFKGIQKRHIRREQSIEQSAQQPLPLLDRFHTPGTQAAAHEEADLLYAALASLPEEYRQVLHLRNWQQLSFEQIGEHLGKSADAVRKIWYRALVRLEQAYGLENKEP